MENMNAEKPDAAIADRLRLARERKGYKTAKDAAEAIGVPYGTYIGHESANRGIRQSALARYAKFFGVSKPWLQFGTDDKEPQPAKLASSPTYGKDFIAAVPVRGKVQAGVWMEQELFEDDGFSGERIPSLPGPWSHLPQFAYKVEGNSVDLLRINDGDYVVCVGYFDARPDIKNGDLAVVERRRGASVERTVKQIEATEGRATLWPRSTDSRHRPITVEIKSMVEDDGTEVELVGLVIGRWSFF